MAATELPAQAYLIGLAGLARMGPRRFRALLAGRSPAEAWALVRAGGVADVTEVAVTLEPEGHTLTRRWARDAHRADLPAVWARHVEAGITVLAESDAAFPEPLVHDTEPPAVLFARGDLAAIGGARVAIVGTRRCTQYGREVAHELGRDLSAAGVHVVSGLALGIDGAAHTGALQAGVAAPVAVVGNGLDIAYPRRHAELYRRIAATGLLLSEYPLGAQPRTWTFPARNRIVAALSHAVVVVECHERGGSMYTVEEADARDIEVFVVPGSVRSPASVGTNKMLYEGKAPVRDADDVLLHLGLSAARLSLGTALAPTSPSAERTAPPPELLPVLDAIGWEETSLEQLLLRTGLGMAELHGALDDLETGGWVVWAGNWVERSGSGARR